MDSAKHLVGQIDPMRAPRNHAIKRRTTRTIDARQAEHPRPAVEPSQVSRAACRSPADDGGGFIDPSPICIAIDAG